VCAFANSTLANRVSFLACMDESKGTEGVPSTTRKLLGGGGGGGDALKAAEKCAAGSAVDVTALDSCYKGPEGQSLLAAAAVVFNKQKINSVPHTFVNGQNVDADYAPLKKALCAAGSSAAVCKKSPLCII